LTIDQGLSEQKLETVLTQLESLTLLFLPLNCVSVEGHNILYMRPSNVYPSSQDISQLIKSLVFLLEIMTDREIGSDQGICFIADMESSWGWRNFGVSYATQFFDTLSERFPCRVVSFFIVAPPSWFGLVWMIIRPIMVYSPFSNLRKLRREPAIR
jgi:hypothetical protein